MVPKQSESTQRTNFKNVLWHFGTKNMKLKLFFRSDCMGSNLRNAFISHDTWNSYLTSFNLSFPPIKKGQKPFCKDSVRIKKDHLCNGYNLVPVLFHSIHAQDDDICPSCVIPHWVFSVPKVTPESHNPSFHLASLFWGHFYTRLQFSKLFTMTITLYGVSVNFPLLKLYALFHRRKIFWATDL